MNSAQQPATTFAGETAPDHSHRDRMIAGGMVLLASLVMFPMVALATMATWGCFTWLRIKHSVLWAVMTIYAVTLVLSGRAVSSATDHVASWTMLVGLFADSSDWQSVVMEALWMQAPAAGFVGMFLGILFSWWRWYRRPSWEVFDFRLTPWQWLMRKKNINDIRIDKHSPQNGKTVGVETTTGKKIIQTDAEARAHTLVVGSTGSGKTTTLMLMARDIIKRGQGLIFVDLKGSPDVANILHEYSERYGRSFQHWTMQTPGETYMGPDDKGPAFYDPLNRGDASRRTNLVMAGREWTEPYYETLAQDYLQRAFEVVIQCPASGAESSFSELASLFDPRELRERASMMNTNNPRNAEILRQIDEYFSADGSLIKNKGTESALKSVEAELRILTNSTAGAWLRKDPVSNNDINLRNVADKGAVVVFSLDSNNYESDANRIGNLIIQDLKTVTSELMNNPSENILQVYIDEFSAIDSENIVGLINKSRAANVPVTLSTQAIDDLRRSSESFMGRVVANINSFIIHRANDFDDAEEYAKLTGKVKKQQFNQQVEHSTSLFSRLGKGSGTGKGNLVEVEDYRVSPSRIQELGTGEAVYIAKSPLRFEYVTVVPEDDSMVNTQAEPRSGARTEIPDLVVKEDPVFVPRKAGTGAPRGSQVPVFETDDSYGNLPAPEVKRPDPEALNRIFGHQNRVRNSGVVANESIVDSDSPFRDTTASTGGSEEPVDTRKRVAGSIKGPVPPAPRKGMPARPVRPEPPARS